MTMIDKQTAERIAEALINSCAVKGIYDLSRQPVSTEITLQTPGVIYDRPLMVQIIMRETDEDRLARAAYDARCRRYGGNLLLPFDKLSDADKQPWRDVVAAVRNTK
jgi:hypothetical protein